MEKLYSRIIPYTELGMLEAVEQIRQGKLVSFPTETVYGLGANALDISATTLIFTTKSKFSSKFR